MSLHPACKARCLTPLLIWRRYRGAKTGARLPDGPDRNDRTRDPERSFSDRPVQIGNLVVPMDITYQNFAYEYDIRAWIPRNATFNAGPRAQTRLHLPQSETMLRLRKSASQQ